MIDFVPMQIEAIGLVNNHQCTLPSDAPGTTSSFAVPQNVEVDNTAGLFDGEKTAAVAHISVAYFRLTFDAAVGGRPPRVSGLRYGFNAPPKPIHH